MERLEQIARFLDFNTKALFDKIYKPITNLLDDDSSATAQRVSDNYNEVEKIILLLSEVIKGQKQILEMEEQNNANLQEMMNLMIATYNK